MTRQLLLIVSIAVWLCACGEKPAPARDPAVDSQTARELARARKELEDERKKNELLKTYVAEATKTINDVQDRLAQIGPVAGSISSRTTNPELRGSFSSEQRDAVLRQINMMQQQLEQSEVEIAAFKQREATFTEQVAELSAMIDHLNKLVVQRSREVATLRETIRGMKVQVEHLETQQAESRQEIGEQQETIAQQGREVAALGEELNTAYVAIGSVRDLVQQKIAVQVGLIRKSRRMAPRLDPTNLTPIDIRTSSEFVFPAPKARVEVISSHPEGSYHIEDREGVGSALVVDQPSFWEFRCLIVGIK